MNFEGKTILVVGGGAGIGAAIGVEAARRGAAVVIADLSPKALKEVSDRIAEVGGEVHTTEVDIGDDASVAAMARWSVETIGAPDILLVTVIDYMSSFSGLDDMSIDDWKRSFEVNFFGYIRVLGQLLPAMRERGAGTVVLTASTVALLPDPTAAVLMRYKTLKHAVLGFSQTLAIALKGSGLSSICFCPSLTATPGAIDNLRSCQLPAARYRGHPQDRRGAGGRREVLLRRAGEGTVPDLRARELSRTARRVRRRRARSGAVYRQTFPHRRLIDLRTSKRNAP